MVAPWRPSWCVPAVDRRSCSRCARASIRTARWSSTCAARSATCGCRRTAREGDLAELDRAQAASREQIVDAYARAVTDSMETLAERLGRALELDLVDADDFAPRRAA